MEILHRWADEADNDPITDSKWFQFKVQITRKISAGGNTKDVKIATPLKYLHNHCKILEIPLIYWEMYYPILTWSENCVITNSTGAEAFEITNIKLHILVVSLSTNDNSKLL